MKNNNIFKKLILGCVVLAAALVVTLFIVLGNSGTQQNSSSSGISQSQTEQVTNTDTTDSLNDEIQTEAPTGIELPFVPVK